MKVSTKDAEIRQAVASMGLNESSSSVSASDLKTKIESSIKGKVEVRKNENGDFHVRRVLIG